MTTSRCSRLEEVNGVVILSRLLNIFTAERSSSFFQAAKVGSIYSGKNIGSIYSGKNIMFKKKPLKNL